MPKKDHTLNNLTNILIILRDLGDAHVHASGRTLTKPVIWFQVFLLLPLSRVLTSVISWQNRPTVTIRASLETNNRPLKYRRRCCASFYTNISIKLIDNFWVMRFSLRTKWFKVLGALALSSSSSRQWHMDDTTWYYLLQKGIENTVVHNNGNPRVEVRMCVYALPRSFASMLHPQE